RGHVEAFVDRALIDSPFSEIAHADPVEPAVLDGKADARGQRDVAADDGVPAQESELGIEEVHRAALAPGASGGLAQELGHRPCGAHAARERMTMVAIGRDDIIALAQYADRPDRDGLLAAVLVKEASDLPLLIEHLGPLLEAANQHHLPQPEQGLRPIDD